MCDGYERIPRNLKELKTENEQEEGGDLVREKREIKEESGGNGDGR